MFQNEDEEAARHFIENKMTEALVRWVLNYVDLSNWYVESDKITKLARPL